MASAPEDIRWPPSSTGVDFDSLWADMVALKEYHFPEHTARDLADPYNQQMALLVALAQNALGRVNKALLNFSPKSINTRGALIALLEVVNRPLAPAMPSRGSIYAKVNGTQTLGTVLVDTTQRVAQLRIQDPVFTFDEEVLMPDAVIHLSHYDESLETITELTGPNWSGPLAEGDGIVIEFDTLAFDAFTLTFVTPLVNDDATISMEYRNTEYGTVDSVSDLGGTLEFTLNGYLHQAEALAAPVDLIVTIRYKPTGVSSEVLVANSGGDLIAVTSYLGQTVPSTSPADYEVFAEWRPMKNVTDGTVALSESGEISWNIADVFSSTDEWAVDEDSGRYSVRIRIVDLGSNANPSTLTVSAGSNTGDWYVVSAITQGYRQRISIGQTDGSQFQFVQVTSLPIHEPVADPKITIEVGADTEWIIVDDFSNSDATSKHAVFREDPDDGWGIIFGDGSVGQLPTAGETVRVTYRTGSLAVGDLDPNTVLRSLGGPAKLVAWALYRGTTGYAVPEANDRAAVQRFRAQILPQLALRAESAVTRDEIVQALTGGAPNRATFTTSDGRKPFSRALFTLEGAGTRQYRAVVVGSESDDVGIPLSADMTEAEEWLNGVEIGVEIIGGHGPCNTDGIVASYVPRYILPTVTITIANQRGVKDTVEEIIRQFFKPHARDENENFRWEFGGRVPMPILFGLMWNALPDRTFIEISATDGVTTWTTGDYVQLLATELVALDDSFDPDTNIILVDP